MKSTQEIHFTLLYFVFSSLSLYYSSFFFLHTEKDSFLNYKYYGAQFVGENPDLTQHNVQAIIFVGSQNNKTKRIYTREKKIIYREINYLRVLYGLYMALPRNENRIVSFCYCFQFYESFRFMYKYAQWFEVYYGLVGNITSPFRIFLFNLPAKKDFANLLKR